MLNYVENVILIKRRRRIREKVVAEYREQTHHKIDYLSRIIYIESQLNIDMKYFEPGADSKNDLAVLVKLMK